MKQIEQCHAHGTIDDLIATRGLSRLLNSLTEITQFIDIHEGLGTHATPELKRRLAKFVAGTSMLASETASTTVARNFGFELEIAAHGATAGLQVRLDESGDIFLLVGSRAVAIECKRLFSKRKVEARIAKGRKQLQCIYDSDQNATGILAIGVSKLINDGSKILRGSTQLDVQRHIDGELDLFVKEFGRHWQERRSPKTLCVLLHFRTPCSLGNGSPLLAVPRQFVFVDPLPNTFHDRQILDRIWDFFSKLAESKAKTAKV